MNSARLAMALAILGASVLSACSLLPCFERYHASGLLIACRDPIPATTQAQKDGQAYAWELAEQHPDVFGFPWADPASGDLEVRITGPDAEPFLAQWLAGTATRGTGDKTLPLPVPQVPIRRVKVDRTFGQLRALMDGILPPKDLPDGRLIWMDGPDEHRNAIAVWIDHQSDALLASLAARYGTAAIVIHVEPDPHIGY